MTYPTLHGSVQCMPVAPWAQPESSITIYIVERELACFINLRHHPLHLG